MLTEREKSIFDSFQNEWLAFCQLQREYPSSDGIYAMNILGRTIAKVRCEYEMTIEPSQITIDEWLSWLKLED